jgi:hypothetical protein
MQNYTIWFGNIRSCKLKRWSAKAIHEGAKVLVKNREYSAQLNI